MAKDILIVDDEEDIRDLIADILTDEGYKTRKASSGLEALSLIQERQPGLTILDVWLGNGEQDGLSVLDTILKNHPYAPVVMISGHGTIETAVSAIKKGAYDFIEKPFQADRLLLAVERAFETSRLRRENDELKIKACIGSSFIGNSSASVTVRQKIEKLAPTNGRVFIYGPLGSDRELVAREIHKNSRRFSAPFLHINCLAFSPSHIEAELFGSEVIGNSNETFRKIGLFEQAHMGTVFIDEIAYLPLLAQRKVLKILQEGSFCRLGSNQIISIDTRVISGSSIDVKESIHQGDLRADLFSRLSVNIIDIPPLRERVSDIPFLADYYMDQIAAAHSIFPRVFTQEAMALLQSYFWPGDIQEFKNAIGWILLSKNQQERAPISKDELPRDVLQGNDFNQNWDKQKENVIVLPLREAREAFEKEYLKAQVRRFSGNISKTAKFVGMERSALHRKLRALGLQDNKHIEEEENSFDER